MNPPPLNTPTSAEIWSLYDRLFDAYGPQHWWPGDSPYEVIVGAILTQNTNWTNVEKALAAYVKQTCGRLRQSTGQTVTRWRT